MPADQRLSAPAIVAAKQAIIVPCCTSVVIVETLLDCVDFCRRKIVLRLYKGGHHEQPTLPAIEGRHRREAERGIFFLRHRRLDQKTGPSRCE
jgi:hypothetical protein